VGQTGSIFNIRYNKHTKSKNKYNNKNPSYAFIGTDVAKEKPEMRKTENLLKVK